MPVKLARLLLDITICCCFDSHPRIDSVLQNSGFRYGLLENAINMRSLTKCGAIWKLGPNEQIRTVIDREAGLSSAGFWANLTRIFHEACYCE
ncbi:MAG: hypothetical protein ACK5HO_02790 [Pseudomonadota bacterium]